MRNVKHFVLISASRLEQLTLSLLWLLLLLSVTMFAFFMYSDWIYSLFFARFMWVCVCVCALTLFFISFCHVQDLLSSLPDYSFLWISNRAVLFGFVFAIAFTLFSALSLLLLLLCMQYSQCLVHLKRVFNYMWLCNVNFIGKKQY